MLKWSKQVNNKVTKLFQVVKSKADCEELQSDLAKLTEGSIKWQVKQHVICAK